MNCAEREGWILTRARGPIAEHRSHVEGRYRPVSEVLRPQSGTLEHFLTERYCLYTTDGHAGSFAGDSSFAVAPAAR